MFDALREWYGHKLKDSEVDKGVLLRVLQALLSKTPQKPDGRIWRTWQVHCSVQWPFGIQTISYECIVFCHHTPRWLVNCQVVLVSFISNKECPLLQLHAQAAVYYIILFLVLLCFVLEIWAWNALFKGNDLGCTVSVFLLLTDCSLSQGLMIWSQMLSTGTVVLEDEPPIPNLSPTKADAFEARRVGTKMWFWCDRCERWAGSKHEFLEPGLAGQSCPRSSATTPGENSQIVW